MSVLPEPPAVAALEYEFESFQAGRRLVRVHDHGYGEAEFNPSLRPAARFRPVGSPPVPTLYAGLDEDVAIAEGLFHDVPIRPGLVRQYPLAALAGRVISTTAPRRDLKLVQLHGYGLQRLGLTHGELIETPAASYDWTARWASALYAAAPDADGLIWMSRRFTGRFALMLWQQDGRVGTDDLSILDHASPLWEGEGRELVLDTAMRARVRMIV